MEINIQSVRCSIGKSLEDRIYEKSGKLDTFYNRIERVSILFRNDKDERKNNKIAEIRLSVPGPDLFAAGRAADFDAAFDSAFTGIRNQLRRFKGKRASVR
jgi:ribosomal subunit interface protein